MSFSTAPQFRDSAGGKTVDPRLLDILQTAAGQFGLNVQATSGVAARSTGTKNHPGGYAVDIQLVDPSTGKVLPNYQNAQSFAAYQQFANTARQVQQAKYPELSSDFRWGGYFAGGPNPMDLMHFDINPSMNGAMGGGSWANGPTAAFAKQWGLPTGSALDAIAQAAPTPFPAPAGTAPTLAYAPKPSDMASLYGPAPAPLVGQGTAPAPDMFANGTPTPSQIDAMYGGTSSNFANGRPTDQQVADMYGGMLAPLSSPPAMTPTQLAAIGTGSGTGTPSPIQLPYVPPPLTPTQRAAIGTGSGTGTQSGLPPQTVYVAPDGSTHLPPTGPFIPVPGGGRPNVPALPSPSGSLAASGTVNTGSAIHGSASLSGSGSAPAPAPRNASIGIVAPGNIDLNNRPVYFGNDGTYGTERSFSIGTDQGEVLIPQIVNGKLVSQQDAINHYMQTGENLGTFTTPGAAEAYATQLHQRDQGLANMPVPMPGRPAALSVLPSMPAMGTVNIPPSPKYPLIQTISSPASPPYSSIRPPSLSPVANSTGAKANGSDGWATSMPPPPIPRPAPPAPVPLPTPAWQSPIVPRPVYPGDLSGGGMSSSVYPGDLSGGGVSTPQTPPLNLGIPPPHIPSPVRILPTPTAIPASIGAVPPVPFGTPPWLAPVMPQSAVFANNPIAQIVSKSKYAAPIQFLSGSQNNYSYLNNAASKAGVPASTRHAALMAQQNRSNGSHATGNWLADSNNPNLWGT